jgi:hypothetical protein
MQLPLPHGKRPIATVFGAVAFGAFLAGAGPQLPNLVDRPACGETVMKAVSTEKPVSGTVRCFSDELRMGLSSAGIETDQQFADRLGKSGTYHFVHRTEDGGYVYEYDRNMLPHNQLQGAFNALKRRDLVLAWEEITGSAQHPTSKVYTLYIDNSGKVAAVL